jgi:hypothetical protein
MIYQITPNECPGPPSAAQAVNTDLFSVFDAQVDLDQ